MFLGCGGGGIVVSALASTLKIRVQIPLATEFFCFLLLICYKKSPRLIRSLKKRYVRLISAHRLVNSVFARPDQVSISRC